MIVAFTGHRPDPKLGGYDESNPIAVNVKTRIKQVLLDLKPTKVISGMALGVDQMAAKICIDMKIPFIAAVPFKGQECKWPKSSQEYYGWLLDHAEEIKVISEGSYDPVKMHKRNEWMVDNCDILIAVFDGTPGGTASCVRYAERQRKDIRFIRPLRMS